MSQSDIRINERVLKNSIKQEKIKIHSLKGLRTNKTHSKAKEDGGREKGKKEGKFSGTTELSFFQEGNPDFQF